MVEPTAKSCLASQLSRQFTAFQIDSSSLSPGFNLEKMFAEVKACRVVKENVRRQVYHLQMPGSGYFLKRSCLVRKKDRLRLKLLPRRKWAEWRNLHRLLHLQIPAAGPVARGYQSGDRHTRSYFILTRQVPGKHIPFQSIARAESLGRYAAFLHGRGVYHADLNRRNYILNPDGRYYLLDTQEVYFLPWIPGRLRIANLGRIIFNHCTLDDSTLWVTAFLKGYGSGSSKNYDVSEVTRAARRHQERRYRSRSKRCCKNSTEFEVVLDGAARGFRRRSFNWGAKQLQQALENGTRLKDAGVSEFKGVCIKTHRRRLLHQDRCRSSWKMSRALEVRGIAVPHALGYFATKHHTHFLSEYMQDSLELNEYLSSISDPGDKRRALAKLAHWVRRIHNADVWQRDFKSKNILCRQHDYFLIDLDGVRIRRLTLRDRIFNLAQINASLSNVVTIRDRLRFYKYYAADAGISRRTRRRHYQEIWDITKTKGTSNYGLYLEEMSPCAPDRSEK